MDNEKTPAQETRYTYDALNRLISITNPEGAKTSMDYDKNRTEITDPKGNKIKITYNPLNQITSITDENGDITQISYDKAGRIIKTINSKGAKAYNAYANINDKP